MTKSRSGYVRETASFSDTPSRLHYDEYLRNVQVIVSKFRPTFSGRGGLHFFDFERHDAGCFERPFCAVSPPNLGVVLGQAIARGARRCRISKEQDRATFDTSDA